jgi:outer membrane protein OmpA-like peptidoglycan-associated protein
MKTNVYNIGKQTVYKMEFNNMRKIAVISSVVLMSACSSLPVPPVVDGGDRHPVNSRETAELLSLRAQLAQIQEIIQLRKQTTTTLPTVLNSASVAAPVSQIMSHTVNVLFPFNGTKFNPTINQTETLLPLLADAKRVVVRGRTDGQHMSAADEQVALNRALSAQRYLVNQGVSPLIISINYLSAGDYVADNNSMAGRAQNRRVEIEVHTESN